jgi:hypothetical protein
LLSVIDPIVNSACSIVISETPAATPTPEASETPVATSTPEPTPTLTAPCTNRDDLLTCESLGGLKDMCDRPVNSRYHLFYFILFLISIHSRLIASQNVFCDLISIVPTLASVHSATMTGNLLLLYVYFSPQPGLFRVSRNFALSNATVVQLVESANATVTPTFIELP